MLVVQEVAEAFNIFQQQYTSSIKLWKVILNDVEGEIHEAIYKVS